MKTIKIPILLIVLILLVVCMGIVLSYSPYGAPHEFGNITTTTCWIGGDYGELNCTGSAYIGGDITASNFYGTFTGNSSIWSRAGTFIFPTNIGDLVGIGTSSPDSAFHIKAGVSGLFGQIIIQNPADDVTSNAAITAYESDGSGNPDQQLWYLGSSSSGNEDIIFWNRGDAKLTLGTNDISRITILGNGNVGIGTATPASLLEVSGGNIEIDDTALIGTRPDGTNFRTIIGVQQGDDVNGVDIILGQNSVFIDDLLWLGQGEVGIGTATPQHKLHVVGGPIMLSASETNGTNKFNYFVAEQYNNAEEPEGWTVFHARGGDGTNILRLGGSTAGENAATEINFYTAADTSTRTGTNRMTIGSTGNVAIDGTTFNVDAGNNRVGIGLSGPTEKLQVSGNIFMTNDNDKMLFGAAKDASIYYNGTHLFIDTQEVGAGDLIIPNGNVRIGGDAYITGTIINTDFTTLTDNSMADALHRHSELSASDGTPDQALVVDATGNIQFKRSASTALSMDTADASDNKYLVLGGGGSPSSIRGAVLLLGGNEEATYPGRVLLNAGSGAGMYVALDGTLYVKDGLVGIGTSSPSVPLEVSESSAETADSTGDMLYLIDLAGTAGNRVGLALSAGGGQANVGARIVGVDDGSYGTDIVFETRDEGSAGTDTDERVRIDSDTGNVGIGTTTPAAKLAINGGLHVGGDSDPGDNNLLVDGTGRFTGIINADATATAITSDGDIYTTGTVDDIEGYKLHFRFPTTGGSPLCFSSSTGPSGAATSSILKCTPSSIKYKENIEDLDLGLEEVMRLRPISFDYKKKYILPTETRTMGFLAEDIEKITPLLVRYDEENQPENVRYREMVVLLTKAIQEQQEEIKLMKQSLCKLGEVQWC